MKTKKAALVLYLIAVFVAIIATIMGNDVLLLISKPVVIPAIFFYYLSIKKQIISWLFALVLLLNFIGDSMVLLEFENQTELIMIPYLLSYIILLKFAIEDVRIMKFNSMALCLSLFVFCFLMYIMIALIQLFKDTNPDLVIPVILYGIILAAYGSITVYCYYMKNNSVTFFMIMVALLSIVSDVFYIMFSLIFHFKGFNYFEFAVQLVSYFFIVKYFVLRDNNPLTIKVI